MFSDDVSLQNKYISGRMCSDNFKFDYIIKKIYKKAILTETYCSVKH